MPPVKVLIRKSDAMASASGAKLLELTAEEIRREGSAKGHTISPKSAANAATSALRTVRKRRVGRSISISVEVQPDSNSELRKEHTTTKTTEKPAVIDVDVQGDEHAPGSERRPGSERSSWP